MKASRVKYFESFIVPAVSGVESKTVTRVIKIPILVDELNTAKLLQTSNCCTFLWNHITELRRDTDTGYGDLGSVIKQLKVAHPELKLPSSVAVQKVCEQHQDNFKSYLTKHRNGDAKAKPPGFKSSKYFYTQDYRKQFSINRRELRIAYGSKPKDWIAVQSMVDLPAGIVLNSLEISRDRKSGQFYAHFTVKLPIITEVNFSKGLDLVFDPGCKTALTGMRSDGKIVEYDINPLRKLNMKLYHKLDKLISERDRLPCSQELAWYRKHVKHFVGPQLPEYIRQTEPIMSRKYQRLDQRIDKGFQLIRSRTKQNLNKLAKTILDENKDVKIISVGDWSPPETVADTGNSFANKKINRAVQNNNPVRALIGYLTQKAPGHRQKVVEFDERGTTRTCSNCGTVGNGVPTSQRVFTCSDVYDENNLLVSPGCGFRIERDVNSTLNMHRILEHGAWRALNSLTEFKRRRVCMEPHSAVKLKTIKSLVLAERPLSAAWLEVPAL